MIILLNIIKILFWVSFTLLFWIFIGYPLSLWMLNRKKLDKKQLLSNVLPSVSIIIPTYNESIVIKKKIENTMALDYPSEKLSY